MRYYLLIVALSVFGTAGLAGSAGAQPPAKGPAVQPGHAPPFLGVAVGPVEDEKGGVLIREVTPDSPAATAGLKAGDRVEKVGDRAVKDVDAFMNAVAAHKPGDKVALTVERDGKPQNLTATLGERPAATTERPRLPGPMGPPAGRAPAFLGVNLQPLTPELRAQLKVDAEAGAVIAEVVPGSPAETAGLKRDDVVTAVGDRQIRSPADLREAIQQTGPGKDINLAVTRGGEKLTVKARPRAGSFGYFLTPGDERIPSVDVGSMIDQGRRIRDLERRVSELEKRLQQLDHKPGPAK